MAMTPNSESANSPRARPPTKNAPRIALKSVKTFAATMLEVEREEVSGGGPSLASRAAASALDSPCSSTASVIGTIYTGAAGWHLAAGVGRDRVGPSRGPPGGRVFSAQLQRSPMIPKKLFLPLAIVLVGGLIAAGCGGGDDTSGDSVATT